MAANANARKFKKAAEKLAEGGYDRKKKAKLVHQWAELAKAILRSAR